MSVVTFRNFCDQVGMMIQASNSVQCQQCGGTASPVSGRDYMQCNYCLSLVFSSGNPLLIDKITPIGGETDAACPVCTNALCMGQLEGRPVLYCGGCYGMLIRNEHFGTIVRERRARRKGCEGKAAQPLDPGQYNRQIGCPNCQKRMEVHPYYGPGNIVIDSCSACEYIWLDHGELRTVEQVEGGVEPALLPLHVNEDGELTIIPPPPAAQTGRGVYRKNSPLAVIADAIFG